MGTETIMEKTIDETVQGSKLAITSKPENTKKLFIESYGCAMNFSDSEIVASILSKEGYNTTPVLEEADLVLVNTCSIRDKAEQTVRKRLEKYNAVKRINPKMKVGVLGCKWIVCNITKETITFCYCAKHKLVYCSCNCYTIFINI